MNTNVHNMEAVQCKCELFAMAIFLRMTKSNLLVKAKVLTEFI